MSEPSFVVTVYQLFIGAADSTTGYYQRGYTVKGAVVLIYPEGGTFNFSGRGYHTVNQPVGITEYDIKTGDIILDPFGKHYIVKYPKMWSTGDQFVCYELMLEEMPVFPYLTGFFGFEDKEHGTLGYEFETGFERGTWAL